MNKVDVVMVALAIFSIAILSIDSVMELDEKEKEVIHFIDASILFIFWVEFGFKLWKAEKKAEFVKKSWADIIGMIPISLLSFRIFRLFRLARMFRISKGARLIKILPKAEKFVKRIRKIAKRFAILL